MTPPPLNYKVGLKNFTILMFLQKCHLIDKTFNFYFIDFNILFVSWGRSSDTEN